MSYQERIRNIDTHGLPVAGSVPDGLQAYRYHCGGQDMRHAAAEIGAEADARVEAADALVEELAQALTDMNNGWKYIRQSHGDLYGVGWDRAQDKADAALQKYAAAKGAK